MQQNNTNPEEIKQSYFKIRSSSVEHLKELIHDLKWNKSDELNEKIKELEQELENLKNTKKYWLVWDSEKEPEQVVLDCQKKLPILKEEKTRKILNDDSWDSNLLIEWDNYHALQVLNYTHKEAIDVIYIDPPYNTWWDDFIYNDKIVDLEDTYRHSKWLNFMEKRLKLSHNLLKEDGIIFISIDDNEQAQLKLLCDEIFWENNFISTIPRVSKTTWFKWKFFTPSKDFILCYSKNSFLSDNFKDEVIDSQYKKEDKDWKYRDDIAFYLSTLDARPNQRYYIEAPDWSFLIPPWNVFPKDVYDGSFVKPNDNNDKVWRWNYESYFIKKHMLSFKETKNSPLLDQFWNKAKYNIYTKSYLESKKETWNVPRDFLLNFLNRNWSETLKEFDIEFSYPKPIELVKHLIKISNKSKCISILDFTAWSWTTWHAVLDLNKEDWGNRKFILCTNNENNICEEITYERIKRVSNWYTNSKWKEIEWLWGNLRYYKTSFVEIESLKEITDKQKLELTYNAWELLAIKEWIYNELEKNDFWQIFENTTDIVAIYFKESTRKVQEMKERLKEIQGKKWWKVKWYIYNNPFDKNDFKDLKGLELKDIPDPILKVYREINRI